MKLKFEYDAPSRDRIKNRMHGIVVPGMWYNKATGWVTKAEPGLDYYPTQRCRSFRKFKRILRKNPHLIGKAKLTSLWRTDEYYYTIHSIE